MLYDHEYSGPAMSTFGLQLGCLQCSLLRKEVSLKYGVGIKGKAPKEAQDTVVPTLRTHPLRSVYLCQKNHIKKVARACQKEYIAELPDHLKNRLGLKE